MTLYVFLDLVSRVLIATGYLILAGWLWKVMPAVPPWSRPARWFLIVVCAVWAVWFLTLAVLRPPPLLWVITTNRMLHVPTVVALGLLIWGGKPPRDS